MSEEAVLTPSETAVKVKRAYTRRQPAAPVQRAPAPPNPQILELESGIVPLVNQRLAVNQKVRLAAAAANQSNQNLQFAQNELAEIEQEINYRMQLIAQLKNGGVPVAPYAAQGLGQPQGFAGPSYPVMTPSAPYNPVVPYPNFPTFDPVAAGVGSFPAPNRGLYPDATDRLESAEDVRQSEIGRR